MRQSEMIKLALIAVCVCAGCKQVTTITKVQVCDKCEDKALYAKKIIPPGNLQELTLKPDEVKSLSNALPTGPTAAANTHLHANVANGELVFHNDSDPTHIEGSQLEVVVEKSDGSGPTPVRVVASAEAASLLKGRTK